MVCNQPQKLAKSRKYNKININENFQQDADDIQNMSGVYLIGLIFIKWK